MIDITWNSFKYYDYIECMHMKEKDYCLFYDGEWRSICPSCGFVSIDNAEVPYYLL